MSSALVAALFAVLGTGLVVTSTACFVLWRQVRALTPPATRPVREGPRPVSVALPVSGLEMKPAKARYEVARRLDELAGRHRSLEARLARVEASSTEAAIAIASRPGRPWLGLGRRVDRGTPATSDGPTLISVPDLAAPSSPASEAEAMLGRRFGAVWAMADSGVPVETIARETGHPIGQVELILGLRRQILGAEARADG
jgi:hypothetical protein